MQRTVGVGGGGKKKVDGGANAHNFSFPIFVSSVWVIARFEYYIPCVSRKISSPLYGMVSLINQLQTRTINELDYDSDGEARELVSKLPPEISWESDLKLGILYNRLTKLWPFFGFC